MRITDLLKPTAIELNANVSSKSEAIDKLIALHEAAGNLTDSEKFKEDILRREEHSTTAIGEGIAVPHAKSSAVKTPSLSFITVPVGVDYSAPDGKKTEFVKPKVPPTSALPAIVSIRNPSAISTPPPTTNGSICETPFIKCL